MLFFLLVPAGLTVFCRGSCVLVVPAVKAYCYSLPELNARIFGSVKTSFMAVMRYDEKGLCLPAMQTLALCGIFF